MISFPFSFRLIGKKISQYIFEIQYHEKQNLFSQKNCPNGKSWAKPGFRVWKFFLWLGYASHGSFVTRTWCTKQEKSCTGRHPLNKRKSPCGIGEGWKISLQTARKKLLCYCFFSSTCILARTIFFSLIRKKNLW